MKRWFAALLVIASLLAIATVPTPAGLAFALGFLFVALILFATTHRGSPFEDMMRRRRAS